MTPHDELNQLRAFTTKTLHEFLMPSFNFSLADVELACHALAGKGLITAPEGDCEYLPESLRKDAPAILINLSLLVNATVMINHNLKAAVWDDSKATAVAHGIIPTGEPWHIAWPLEKLPEIELRCFLAIGYRYIRLFTEPLNIKAIEAAYQFTMDDRGGIHALTSGDMGYEPTGIRVDINGWTHRGLSEAQRLQQELGSWSDETFGIRNASAPIAHLQKEVVELAESPADRSEYADCLMLLLDAYRMNGGTADDLIQAAFEKLEINKNRTWGKPDANGVVEHVDD